MKPRAARRRAAAAGRDDKRPAPGDRVVVRRGADAGEVDAGARCRRRRTRPDRLHPRPAPQHRRREAPVPWRRARSGGTAARRARQDWFGRTDSPPGRRRRGRRAGRAWGDRARIWRSARSAAATGHLAPPHAHLRSARHHAIGAPRSANDTCDGAARSLRRRAHRRGGAHADGKGRRDRLDAPGGGTRRRANPVQRLSSRDGRRAAQPGANRDRRVRACQRGTRQGTLLRRSLDSDDAERHRGERTVSTGVSDAPRHVPAGGAEEPARGRGGGCDRAWSGIRTAKRTWAAIRLAR